MHWSEVLADKIISERGDKDFYTCAGGISPSGSVHIGNFRDIATPYFVVKALQSKGKKARLLFSWDDFDRLRKVPSNVQSIVEGFEENIGIPYTMCPDPHNEEESYGRYFEIEFENALKKLGVDCDIKYQTKKYLAGEYKDQIVKAIVDRKKCYDILMSFKTQEASDEDRENYYPLNVYCSKCHKDTTKVVSSSGDGEEITYECKSCGNHETVKTRVYPLIKLVWKLDWPMRWVYEGVDFEPGGIDHAAASGSFVVSREIVKEIYGGEAPIFQGYGWLGIKGLGNMHSSSGMNLTPDQIMKIYEPEMVRWLFAKYDPADSFDFAFDDTIIRHYSEFDKGLVAYKNGELPEYETKVYDLALFKGKDTKVKAPFGVLASVAPIVDFKPDMVKKVMQKLGYEFDDDSLERLEKVKNWIEIYQPQKKYVLLSEKNTAYFDSMSEEDKEVVKKLHDYIASHEVINDKEVQQFLYDIMNDPSLSKKENMNKQMANFKNLYNLLFGLEEGPRLYLFFAAADKEVYNKLLEF
ncbi:MAG: lysine--tRNA ligase [Clostridiales bacterium]|nr:lysine--tRNA ligase [Candidatus Apopatousia equi]